MRQICNTRREILTPAGHRMAPAILGKELIQVERRILGLMSQGRSDTEIAQQLALNCLTVWVLRTNALMKLGVSSVEVAGALARQAVPCSGGMQAGAVVDQVEGR